MTAPLLPSDEKTAAGAAQAEGGGPPNIGNAANAGNAGNLADAAYRLCLYVAGNGSRSVHAIANLKRICEQHLKDGYRLEVVDLYEYPERAKDEQIVAIPTLVREQPLPVRRIVGDLSDTAQVCASLDISPVQNGGSRAETMR
jgi:circadian clock protein KaiB